MQLMLKLGFFCLNHCIDVVWKVMETILFMKTYFFYNMVCQKKYSYVWK